MARISERQKVLFEALAEVGPLSLAIGHPGVTAHIVDRCSITSEGNEDRLDFGDGTHHLHIDWSRVKRADLGVHEGRAVLTFLDGNQVLFRIYKPEGDYPPAVVGLLGDLVPTPY